jgi:hypothetical protein
MTNSGKTGAGVSQRANLARSGWLPCCSFPPGPSQEYGPDEAGSEAGSAGLGHSPMCTLEARRAVLCKARRLEHFPTAWGH